MEDPSTKPPISHKHSSMPHQSTEYSNSISTRRTSTSMSPSTTSNRKKSKKCHLINRPHKYNLSRQHRTHPQNRLNQNPGTAAVAADIYHSLSLFIHNHSRDNMYCIIVFAGAPLTSLQYSSIQSEIVKNCSSLIFLSSLESLVVGV